MLKDKLIQLRLGGLHRNQWTHHWRNGRLCCAHLPQRRNCISLQTCVSASLLEPQNPIEVAVQGASLHVALAVAQAQQSAPKRSLPQEVLEEQLLQLHVGGLRRIQWKPTIKGMADCAVGTHSSIATA